MEEEVYVPPQAYVLGSVRDVTLDDDSGNRADTKPNKKFYD